MNSNMNVRNQDRPRPGLTLIELLVVLTILIALAAILIPMMPNVLSRSHDSSSATNISEISRAVQTYNQLYFGFPNNLDNLIEAGSGTGSGTALLGTLAGPTPLNGQVVAAPLNAQQATALNNIGITSLANLTGSAPAGNPNWSPTFSPYTTIPPSTTAIVGTTATTGTGGTATSTTTYPTVAFLTGTATITGTGSSATTGVPTGGVLAAVTKLGASPTGTYVVFGFGLANSAIGQVVQECPVHFPDQSTISPANFYERYGLIFKVSDSAYPTMQNAVFVGVVCLLDDGIESAGDHIQDFFNLSATKQ